MNRVLDREEKYDMHIYIYNKLFFKMFTNTSSCHHIIDDKSGFINSINEKK